MLPNFLIVGASRCGTSWMAKNLKLHPQIYMPSIKELHFFDREFAKGWNYYASFFPEAKCRAYKAIGEATPAYLYMPQVADLIASNMPDVKIIVSLRNPIDRAYSHYWNLVATAPEGHVNDKLTFEEKLAFTPRLLDEGFYDLRLSSYYERFPRQNILILIFEEMVKDQATHFKRIHEFLGVDEEFVPPLLDIRINSAASKLGRSRVLDLVYKTFYKIIRIPALSRRIDDINARPPPAMDSATRQALRKRYVPTIQNLESLLGRDLRIWGE